MSETSSTTLSIVIASAAGGDFLYRCLESLRRDAEAVDVETIVVDRCGQGRRDRVRRRFPFALVLQTGDPDPPSVPSLRAHGVRAARGDVVAILEEHCVAPDGWISAVRQAFGRENVVAAGGPILDDDYDRIRDWVVYLSEYHNYLPPWTDGERASLNGANIAYRREALLGHSSVLAEGYWEVVLNPKLLEEGGYFRAAPLMAVRHTGPFDYGYYLRQRYLLSRAWGGTQRQRVGKARRLVYLAGAPLFPALLLARIAAAVSRSDLSIGKYILALPALVPVAVAYVWGEWLGYLLGPGKALDEIE